MKLLVLFGGVSSEHEISCLSAASILRNLDTEKYEVLAVGITREGAWRYLPSWSADEVQSGAWCERDDLIPAVLSPDRMAHGLLLLTSGAAQTVRVDCVFPVLHGVCGEDGTVQGLLELAGVPYVGCGVSACANSMDKSLTKVLAADAGVRQARYYLARRHRFSQDPAQVAREAMDVLQAYPVFVKPCSSGSSVGVAKAQNADELKRGLQDAFRHDEKVLVEEFIDGQEIECAVLGNCEPVASTVGEVAPTQQFYTFDAKYRDDSSALYIPARLSAEQIETARQNALTVYRALSCRGLSRVDFFCERKTGEIIFNELNAIPGFTSISMYPKLFSYQGLHYPALLDRLIACAMEDQHG